VGQTIDKYKTKENVLGKLRGERGKDEREIKADTGGGWG